MIQWLRDHIAVVEDLSFVPSPLIGQFTTTCNSGLTELHTHTQMCKDNENNLPAMVLHDFNLSTWVPEADRVV